MKVKNVILSFCLGLSSLVYSQHYDLVEAKDIIKNNDKRFLQLPENKIPEAQFLGKVVVSDAVPEQQENFKAIYNKAKITGANAFRMEFPENIDGTPRKNIYNYTVLLYYYKFAFGENQEENHKVYIIGLNKDTKIKLNGKRIEIPANHYLKINLTKDITDISTGGFLGSRIRLQSKEKYQAPLYFTTKAFNIKAGGKMNFQTGDIIRLDDSLAQFLLAIDSEIDEI
ncbi:hypothetical protein [Riemerella columbipharyngis]|uniref:Uncharacterized protein n=1 Tax=Riemerella columbipharyngis TaxID=1071918 RepID=A0A1G7DJI5_9FLAO|nr:hypothetical protein [Riemerella columbipharyngis]SDE51679.1 hypothetical protein SAMN05421544_11148 [Riemerella columbipharyngis]